MIAAPLPPDGNLGNGYHVEHRSIKQVAQDENETLVWEVKGPQGKVVVRFGTPTSDVSGTQRFYRSAKGDVLLADRVSSSMGMGVDTWVLTLFHLAGGPPVQVESSDWGPDGVNERNGRIEVLVGDWAWPTFGKPKESLHFVGGWFAYDGDRLRPTTPWLARPLLFSFDAERGASSHEGFWYSARWLRPGKGRPYLGGDPRVGKETAPRVKGKLADVRPEGGGVRATLGSPLWIFGSDGPPEGVTGVTYVGEAGVLMPLGYIPANPKASWEGRRAELATYADFKILWLQTP
ncbi:MAG: hypothetical protein JWM80_1853 [Cyanobacteria bacterium RYN_339]|nr:hypothetical protein [Cyanobacteria bacterium RYN_339]